MRRMSTRSLPSSCAQRLTASEVIAWYGISWGSGNDSSAQRLTASEVIASTICARDVRQALVLNALRHQRLLHHVAGV